ncbi:cobalamin-dependent protein [Calidifontibacillus erzurumensis]|uniref:Cobalamin B12-binding domain-containing protein n=1 Tax=Calidifontibacillus erzurumensis TaxID=2741433 RepID=A0A8J8GEJ9_9BACI|nr:cobalamin-dependent protein [Calidifontibacillus erzurumensis]NSL50958.1 cobalamin B12-binding domain-containing protein [Calidifontibacillus erzurumensis]
MSTQEVLEKQKKKLENQRSILLSQFNYCEDIETSMGALGDYLNQIKRIYFSYTRNENYITLIAERTKQKIDQQLNLLLNNLNKMILLKENYSEMNGKIIELNKENLEVGKRLKETFEVLKDVSLQTNILAINANIEAHRIGQQGTAFKVIATEVGKLSNLTSNSSKNITDTTSKLTVQTSEMTKILQDSNQTLSHVVQELEQEKGSFTSMFRDSEKIVNESIVLDETLKEIYDLIEKVSVMVEYNKISFANIKKILKDLLESTKEMLDDIYKELGIQRNSVQIFNTSNLYEQFYQNFKNENLEVCVLLLQNALEKGIEPTFLTTHILERTVETIGKEQIDRLVPLSEIYVNGKIIEACMNLLIPILEKESKRENLGSIIIGNAFGDYHALGRKIVVTFLRMAGFDVMDLGLSVPNEKFVAAVKEKNAKLVCVSALIIHTADEIKQLRTLLNENGLKQVKILVGGAPFNFEPRLVQAVNADAMAKNGVEAIKVAKELLGLIDRKEVY